MSSVIRAPDFDLHLTLRSGQFFRYRLEGEEFLVIDRDRAIRVRQDGDALIFEGAGEAELRRLFGLDADHGAALAAVSAHPVLARLLPRYGGMRLMRQDPWQCLVSFVCSAASNIPRIARNVESIASIFGRSLGPGLHAFPDPRPVRAADLRPARLGFREPRVAALFSRVTDPWLASLASRPFDETRDALDALPGVGVKVAECVMAFSLGFGEACPVDVWIRRLGSKLFFRGRRTPDRKIAAAFRDRFGRYAALAQQIAFVAGREGKL